MSHPAAAPPETLMGQCDIQFMRRSGPGGQNRNKVETAVILRHRPTGVIAEASERRSQIQNRQAALLRLRVKLALEVRTTIDCGSGPSALWQSRRRGQKIAVNPAHDDYPALLAEALDVLARFDWDVREAATWLGCSATQLVHLLRDEPRGLGLLNQQRQRKGQAPLR